MKKIIVTGLLVVGMIGCLTGCNKKPLEVRNHVSMTVDGQVQEWDDVFYILDGEIVDKDGNPLEE